jgi:protocatechuate 3,4-dioxygenase beta subunit
MFLFAAAVPLARLASACGGSSTSSSSSSTGGTSGGTDAGAAATGGWATGGTASMTGKDSYPNPFASGAPSTCPLTGALTEGPCYDAQAEAIADISYGRSGLPTRVALQILDASCKPIAGATVSVWHVGPEGKYSGNDSANENVSFCTGNDADYSSHLYFRGVQTSDASGVVSFDTCFPGWYQGRTIHIHFSVTVNGKSFTSQFVFDDTLCDAIIADQPLYKDRGARSTKNTNDSVVSASTYPQFLFETKQMTDGAMLAWKSIVVS